jgi:hypothetical protein
MAQVTGCRVIVRQSIMDNTVTDIFEQHFARDRKNALTDGKSISRWMGEQITYSLLKERVVTVEPVYGNL